mmetsp:Transcript_1727/g.2544  ORF Transcript_1727/g.2544 Transcript_1727/m.2544 type:complete len:226 (+) Transcript_1727:1168-1845(+)
MLLFVISSKALSVSILGRGRSAKSAMDTGCGSVCEVGATLIGATVVLRGGIGVPRSRAFKTSPLVTLPPLPVPTNPVASTPLLWLRWRADGIRTNSSETVLFEGVVAELSGVDFEPVSGEGVARDSFSSFSITKSANAATSSASSTTTHTGVPTGSSCAADPSRNILAKTPSSCASKSTVALSVSIEHKTSPAENSSPSFKVQLAMVPVSIVGDKAGIGKTVWGG